MSKHNRLQLTRIPEDRLIANVSKHIASGVTNITYNI